MALAGASPVHLAIRGTAGADTARCAWRGIARTATQREDAIRAWLQLQDGDPLPSVRDLEVLFTATFDGLNPKYRETVKSNFLAIARGGLSEEYLFVTCFADYTVSSYLLGTGTTPGTVTVAYDRRDEARSYELYRREHEAGTFGSDPLQARGDYEASLQDIVVAAEEALAAELGGQERIVFLAPMGAHHAIAFEAWQAVAHWDVETVDGTVNAVRVGAPAGDAEHTQTLADLTSRVTTAATSDAHATTRIGNVSGLQGYYQTIGAYGDITPGDGETTTFTPAQPPAAPACTNGTAVATPNDNRGLVRDCETLLAAKDGLRGTATLNWSTGTAIGGWEGVTTGGTPSRVTELDLASESLTGSIPAGLGQLFELTTLDLSSNQLTGDIPAELGWLTNLTELRLSGNQLTGCIPVALKNVATNDLSALSLLYCAPPAPGNLSAGPPSGTSVGLSWDAVPDAGAYRVEYRAGPDEWTTASDTITGTTFTVDTLRCGTSYDFRVSAQGGRATYTTAWSEPSATVSTTTSPCTPPTFGPPPSFTVTENAKVGDAVGTVTATAAYGNALTYAITEGNAGGEFAIDGASGQIMVAGALDYETASSYTLTVAAQEAEGGTATTAVTITVTDFVIDYDADGDDGLIEVANLAQLHAIRWDLDGDGTATEAGYAQAFPHAPPGMGCPATGCTGYELTADLDFDADDAYGNGGLGWEPIGSEASPFAAVFDGNGHTIANLFIDRSGTSEIGLFGRTRWPSTIRRVGLPGVDVTGGYDTGSLVGWNSGRIEASYASGRVASARAEVGGLVGWNERDVAASYAAVDVTGGDYAGGLVGGNHGAVTASYATGAVTGGATTGGLAGWSDGRITASYATGRVTATSSEVGGLVGSNLQSTVTASYWDRETSGQSASAAGVGKTTSELQDPTGYSGIYAEWNVDIDGASGPDDPGHFGAPSQYPVLQVDFNGDGTATWQEFGEQRAVVANRPPVFAEGSTTTRAVAEHTAAGEDIGEPVMATDPDAGDVVTYALGGRDAVSFDLVRSTGQLQTELALDYELQAAYEVTITASDDRGGTTTITVTIQVGDVADTPEFAEQEYRFTVTEDATVDTEVGTVTATAGGAEVTYAIPAGNTGDAFAIEPATGALSVAAPLDYLTTEVYTLTVSATAGTATADVTVTMAVTGVDCANGTVIDDPRSHAALVGDCRVLLAALEILEGDDGIEIEGGGTLNWSDLRALAQWEGVTTGGTPRRVTGLELSDKSLGGEIPSGLGRLTALTTLDLSANRLTGAVPAELSGLTALTTLRLSGNRVGGCLPTELRALAAAIEARGGAQDLAQLALAYCNATAPPAPTDLAAAATSATSITLTWEGATDAGSLTYHVEYRVADSDDAWTAVVRDEPTAATQVVDGLTCGAEYAFRVSAFGDGVGSLAAQGPWSAAHPAATNGCAPVFDAASYEFPISAGAAVGTPVGTVTATPAGDGALTYAITPDTAAGPFAIDGSSGQLTVAGALEASSYALTVSATEAGGGTATVPVTLTVAEPPAVTVAFGQATYTATEGAVEGVTVTVTLSADPQRDLTIPLTVTPQGGAEAADHTGVPTSVSFAAGVTATSFVVVAVDDAVDDDGEAIQLGFGDLPAQVTAGAPATTTLSLADNDATAEPTDPAVWSATLTVATFDYIYLGYRDVGDAPDGLLTDADFEWQGETYTVLAIVFNSYTGLDVILEASRPGSLTELTLHLDDVDLPVADAEVYGGPQLIWADASLDWTAGDRVTVTLTAPAGAGS